MKPGDLVRIRRPEYGEEYWEQVGVIIEVDDHPGVPNPLRIMTPVDIVWFSPDEVDLVNDDTDGYDRKKENQ
jgi:hypothetical protein